MPYKSEFSGSKKEKQAKSLRCNTWSHLDPKLFKCIEAKQGHE